MNQDNRNLVLAIALSALLVIAYQIFFELPKQEKIAEQQIQNQENLQITNAFKDEQKSEILLEESANYSSNSPRISIDTEKISGSINLLGSKIDEVIFKDFRETIDPNSDNISFFNKLDTERPYFAEIGWVFDKMTEDEKKGRILWKTNDDILTENNSIKLIYESNNGLTIHRKINIDENYLFTFEDKLINKNTFPIDVIQYGRVKRSGTPKIDGLFILHEGLVGVIDENLREKKYSKLEDTDPIIGETQKGELKYIPEKKGGWVGITDKYWLAATMPSQNDKVKYFGYQHSYNKHNKYQAHWFGEALSIAPGESIETSAYVFAGAKKIDILDKVEKDINVYDFDKAINWGWFFFLTKPFFYALNWISNYVGNFGLAIIYLTIIIKLIFFPLANGSYRSMAKMKALQPKLTELRERFKGDQQALNKAMMEMYKTEKVNPAAGCLPIFIQIPVFFALYKVLYISIEMRQAPFYGWIKDLSDKDPTSFINLFGLLPFSAQNLPIPEFIQLGIWPILMGFTMWLQMRLNPTSPDPIQARIFAWMPVVFTFLLATFPSGLVIYWTWNNILSIGQQWLITRQLNNSKK